MQRAEDLAYLVDYLQRERGMGARPVRAQDDPAWFDKTWAQFRALVNTREPIAAPAEFLAVQDRLLRSLIAETGVTDAAALSPARLDGRLALWRGDITTLSADAVVNAANSGMLGCWIPGHFCIDNAIHTYAGVQLRLECARIMREQGHEEPAGQAKVTPAYNLPARWVIHTVGPIADGRPTDLHRAQLAQCYRSCLDAAARRRLATVAFCCISTGVFGFPQEEAARIAVGTVRDWLDERVGADGETNDDPKACGSPAADMRVVFNVFGNADERIYHGLLQTERA